ncbi:phage tail tube protein [uncultured Thiocystis sp.]|jgi:hypothetical protein|uniref:phage tail tube protein n=1 Tax=uncultured Thiocystis sp. TaxID=1202134 RepID=UPI0025EA9952|nr:phage tail tube protein [uncultured Thiocystis sp.]
MAQISGVDIAVALYEETAFGVDPGTPSGTKAYFSSLNVKAAQESIDNPIIAGGRGVPRPGRGNIDVSGAFATTVAPGSHPFWLKQILGAPTGSGILTYVPKALPTSFIIEKDYTSKLASKVERFNDCRVKSASLTLNQSGYIDLSVDVLGKRYGIYTAPLDATLTDPTHEGWTGYQGIVNLDGTRVGGVLGATLSIDNEMDGSLYAFPATGETAGERFSLPEGRTKISGSVDMVFQDFAMVDLALAGDEVSLEWIYTNAAGDALSILIDHAEIPLTSPAIETRSGMKVQYNFSAFSSGSDMGLKIVYTPHV